MSRLFRKTAMDNLAVPEQLNRQISIIRPHMWIIIVAIITALLGIGMWVVFGNITNTVEIEGVVFPKAGVSKISYKGYGAVKDVLVKVGDKVDNGDVIAIIPDELTIVQLEEAKSKLKTLDTIDEIKMTEKEIEKLQEKYISKSVIYANQQGIIQRVAAINDFMQDGDEISSILITEETSNSRQIIGYIPLKVAKQLKVGMEVQASPAHISREEYGYMKGYVSRIETIPVTKEELERYYGTLEYIKDILPDSSCVQIILTMNVDHTSNNLFQWSSQKGKDILVDVGTICNIQIVVDKNKPIDMLIQ